MSSNKIADFWNEASSTTHPPPLKRETVPLVLPKREYEEPVRKRRRLTEDSSTQLSSQQKRRNRPKYRLTLSRFSLPCIYPDCHQKFHFTQSLYGHIKSDHSPAKGCPYCPWEWNKTSYVELVRHARTHTTHKPYVCPFSDCEYAARNKRELQQHLMSSIHDYEMSPELLQQIMSLDRITRANSQTAHGFPWAPHVIPSGSTGRIEQSNDNNIVGKRNLAFLGFELPCIYPGCHEKFRLTQTLYNHIRTHDAPKRQCPYCGKQMESVVQLVGHARTHTKSYPYTCPMRYCKFSAALKSALKRHLQSYVHQHEMSPQLLNHILSWDSVFYESNARMQMAAPNWQQTKAVNHRRPPTSLRNVVPYVISSWNQSTSYNNRTGLVAPPLERPSLEMDPDSVQSTSRTSMGNSSAEEPVKYESKELLHEIIEKSPDVSAIKENINVSTVRIKELENEIWTLTAALFRSQARVNVLEMTCNQKTIDGNLLAQTIRTLNKQMSEQNRAANVQLNILNLRLGSEAKIFRGQICSRDNRLKEQRDLIEQSHIERDQWKRAYDQLVVKTKGDVPKS